MQTILRADKFHSILGVNGRFLALHKPVSPWKDHVFANQTWLSEPRRIKGYGTGALLAVVIRFDDNCRNGHNTFSITADVRIPGKRNSEACGCLHEEIAAVFPELAHLIKWHLVSTDGPLHYIGNAVYLAGDRDFNGLRKGESRQIRNGKTGLLSWKLQACPNNYIDATDQPPPVTLAYEPWLRIGEGKARELDAARRAAIWPDATDDELCVDPELLRVTLANRLPKLMQEFLADILLAGFAWAPSDFEGN